MLEKYLFLLTVFSSARHFLKEAHKYNTVEHVNGFSNKHSVEKLHSNQKTILWCVKQNVKTVYTVHSDYIVTSQYSSGLWKRQKAQRCASADKFAGPTLQQKKTYCKQSLLIKLFPCLQSCSALSIATGCLHLLALDALELWVHTDGWI